MDRAVSAARGAFDSGPWPRLAVEERAAELRRLAAELRGRVDEIAAVLTAEMGAAITATRTAHAPAPIGLLEYYASLADRVSVVEHRAAAMAGSSLIAREPVGVVAAIVPWNAPFWLTMAKLAPALLAGCTVVVKPAPETPLDG